MSSASRSRGRRFLRLLVAAAICAAIALPGSMVEPAAGQGRPGWEYDYRTTPEPGRPGWCRTQGIFRATGTPRQGMLVLPFWIHPCENKSPVAAFSFRPDDGDPHTIHFDGTASRDPDGRIVRYRWSFGTTLDGVPLERDGPRMTAIFPTPGEYRVRLTVTDDQGARDSLTRTITVGAGLVVTVELEPHEVELNRPDVSGAESNCPAPSEPDPYVPTCLMARVSVMNFGSQPVRDLALVGLRNGINLRTEQDMPQIPLGIVGDLPPLERAALEPGEEWLVDYLIEARNGGLFTISAPVRGYIGAALVGGYGETELRVTAFAPNPLEVALQTAPTPIELEEVEGEFEEDENGEQVPKKRHQDVTLTVTITNMSDQELYGLTIQGVTRLARDRSPLAARIEVLGEFPATVGDGVLAPAGELGSTVEVPITVRAHHDGRFRFQVLVTATTDGIDTVRGLGRGGNLDVNPEYLLELKLEAASGVGQTQVSARGGRLVVPGGQPVRLIGGLRNLTTNSTIIVDPLPATTELNAQGAALGQYPGMCPPPAHEIEVGAGSVQQISGDLWTSPEGSTRGAANWPWPSGEVVDDETGERRPLYPEDVLIVGVEPVRLIELEDEIRLELLVDQRSNEQVRLDDAEWAAHYQMGWMEAVGYWTYSSFDVIGAIGRGLGTASTIPIPTLVEHIASGYVYVMLGIAEALTDFAEWARDNPAEFDEFLMKVALTMMGRPEYVFESIEQAYAAAVEAIYPFMANVEQAYASNDDRQVARLLGSVHGSVALEVFTCMIPTGDFARAIKVSSVAKADNVARMAATATRQEQFLRAVPNGQILRGEARMWGVAEDTLSAIQQVCGHFKIMCVLRERSQAAIRLIDELGIAVWKPELMKPKNLSDIDRFLLRELHEPGAIERYRDRVAIFLPDSDDIIKSRLRANRIPEESWDVVLQRAASQRSDYQKYMPEFRKWREEGIGVGLNYADNGLARVGGNPRAIRHFDFVEESRLIIPRMADESGALKWISGDIDWVDFRFLNGDPLDSRTAIQVYRAMQRVAGMQHPELMTWILDGQTVFRAKVNQFKDYVTGGKALLQITGDNIYAVRINEAFSYFADVGRKHWIYYDGGVKTAAAPVFGFGDFQFVGRYKLGVLTPLPYVGPIGWALNATCRWEYTTDHGAMVIRPAEDGGFEVFDGETWAPYTGDTCVEPTLQGGIALGADGGTLRLLPQTALASDATATDTRLEILDLPTDWPDEHEGRVRAWFAPGQTIVIDPGGPRQEVHTIVALGSLVLDRPLEHDHPEGTMVAVLEAAPAGPDPLAIGGPVAVLFGLLASVLLLWRLRRARPRMVATLLALALAAACGGAAAPTPSPTPLRPTPTPIAPPPATPGPTPTDEPTPSPTPTPAPTPTPVPTPAGLAFFNEVFADDFTNHDSGWATGSHELGTADYADGTIQVQIVLPNQALWSQRELGDRWPVLRVEGTLRAVDAAHPGAAGLMCGEDEETMIGALVSTEGVWFLLTVAPGGVADTLGFDRANLPFAPGGEVRLAVECAGTASGPLRVRVEVNGREVANYVGSEEGSTDFDRVAFISNSGPSAVTFALTDVIVSGAQQITPSP